MCQWGIFTHTMRQHKEDHRSLWKINKQQPQKCKEKQTSKQANKKKTTVKLERKARRANIIS